ncbi:glycine betaine ABC transporter substrate-binding protein [Vallitalea guaymasensis]|uniref:glycine betaine ABC transporter substrate-binding protein n=1 Tax=Vallitalea guaymasensis TaxID=1185412 RepID=UPI00235469C7|nr:glycine betaine ABC transporter substrate-binding protein [Vallitalea guaymasensis]
MKKLLIIILCLVLLVSCTRSDKENNDISEDVDIRIGCTTYPSSYAQAILLSEIVNRKGYTSKIIMNDTDKMWDNLGKGKTDVLLSGWVPTIDTGRKAELESLIKDLGTNCRNLSNGIYVPNYTLTGFLCELEDYKEEFSNTIYVCKESNIIIEETKSMLQKYSMEYNIKEVDYEELDALIKKSIDNKEWIAVALWTPNGTINKFGLRHLRDTKNIFTNNIDTHTIVRSEYTHPELLNILDNYFLRTGELNELINVLDENDQEKKIVNSWLDNNLQILNRVIDMK